MTGREQTRWHSQGITADHRPGTRFNSTGKSYKEPTSRYRGIPWNIRHYIETGEGAKPAKPFVEPDGFAVATGPDTRPRCVTEGCDTIISQHGESKLCGKCHKARYAEATRKRYERERKHFACT